MFTPLLTRHMNSEAVIMGHSIPPQVLTNQVGAFTPGLSSVSPIGASSMPQDHGILSCVVGVPLEGMCYWWLCLLLGTVSFTGCCLFRVGWVSKTVTARDVGATELGPKAGRQNRTNQMHRRRGGTTQLGFIG